MPVIVLEILEVAVSVNPLAVLDTLGEAVGEVLSTIEKVTAIVLLGNKEIEAVRVNFEVSVI